MGTRNLTAVSINGEYKVAQYGQWDGYPSGQGATILNFLQKEGNVAKLRSSLEKVRFLDPEGVDKSMVESFNNNPPQWSNEPDNRTDEQKYWASTFLSRDIGGKILHNIISSNDDEIVIKNQIGFADDSLMCEYAYVIDLDKNTFEVFEGFNSGEVVSGRFSSNDTALEKTEGYGPVKLVKEYNLSDLPEESVFISDLETEDEE